MPIGKYIYCTGKPKGEVDKIELVTNAYRQVHLLYNSFPMGLVRRPASQMPIGKYIYCTPTLRTPSQMPIGKYIYCTAGNNS